MLKIKNVEYFTILLFSEILEYYLFCEILKYLEVCENVLQFILMLIKFMFIVLGLLIGIWKLVYTCRPILISI